MSEKSYEITTLDGLTIKCGDADSMAAAIRALREPADGTQKTKEPVKEEAVGAALNNGRVGRLMDGFLAEPINDRTETLFQLMKEHVEAGKIGVPAGVIERKCGAMFKGVCAGLSTRARSRGLDYDDVVSLEAGNGTTYLVPSPELARALARS